jgi:hypothetical protein
MSPGAAIANAISNAPVELLLVIASYATLVGLVVLYRWLRRAVIPNFIPGVAFRSVAGKVIGRAVLRRSMH